MAQFAETEIDGLNNEECMLFLIANSLTFGSVMPEWQTGK
jgi:hypothetical protein